MHALAVPPSLLRPAAPAPSHRRPIITTRNAPVQPRRRRGEAAVRQGGKAPFPTEGPLGKAIVGGVFLGPIGAMFGYFFGLGTEGEKNVEEAKKVKPRPGVTRDLIEQAKELGKELEERERFLEQCVKAVSEARLYVADVEASVAEASNDAKAALQAGDGARSERFMDERARRKGDLELAKEAMLEAMARREAARIALKEAEDRGLRLEASIQESMAISQARMAESPALKRMKEPEGEQSSSDGDAIRGDGEGKPPSA